MTSKSVALALVADGKGILAADETVPTLKRFDALGIQSTEESRRTYREMLFHRRRSRRDACDFSIARMACTRRRAYHRPMNKGCSTMIAMKIQKRDEKSNDMANVLPVCAENFVRLIW